MMLTDFREPCPVCFGRDGACRECSHTGRLSGYTATQDLEMELARCETGEAIAVQAVRMALDLANQIGSPAIAEACQVALDALETDVIESNVIDFRWARERMRGRQ